MPSAVSILANLTMIVNDTLALAVAWHGITLLAVLALSLGWRPSRRAAAILLVSPIVAFRPFDACPPVPV